jgi:hypothetical protein
MGQNGSCPEPTRSGDLGRRGDGTEDHRFFDMPTANQLRRQEASNRKMARQGYRVFTGPLFTNEDGVAIIRSPEQAARRAMILWLLGCYADGSDRDEIRDSVTNCGLTPHLSPNEAGYLTSPPRDPRADVDFKWRLEASWVLLWALRKLWWLNSPDRLCDCKRMVAILAPLESEAGLSRRFSLRSKYTLLDKLDITLRQHWAARDDCIRGVHRISRVFGRVVYQRHYALLWLTSNTPWDEIQTDT